MIKLLLAVALLMLMLVAQLAAAQVVYTPELNLLCHDNVIYPTPEPKKMAYSPDEWRSVCRQFDACIATGTVGMVCQLRIAAERLADCGDDLSCQAEAFIYAAGVNIDYTIPWINNETAAVAIRESLSALDSGDPQIASDVLLQGQTEGMLTLSAAAALRAAGALPRTLELTAEAQWNDPEHVLTNYFAALVLGESGDVQRAAHIVYTLDQILASDPVLEPVITALQTAYPFDESGFEPWLLYRFYRLAMGPGGGSYQDLHTQPPLPVRVLHTATGSLTILDYPSYVFRDHPNAYVVYFPPDETTMSADGAWSGINLQYEPIAAGYWVQQQSRGGEAIVSTELLLVPADSGDPFVGVQPIDCGLLHWLTPGQRVDSSFVAFPDALTVYTEPNGTELDAVNQVILLDEKHCDGSTLWWHVRLEAADGGAMGWLPINQGAYISLESDAGNETPFYCPFALPTRLGSIRSRVIAEDGIVLYAAPDPQSAVIGTLPQATTATAFTRSRPLCVEQTVWWLLRTDDLEGWSAEGTRDVYWLEPIYED